MKRLLLIGCLLAAFACTKDPAELSGGDSGPTPPRIVGTPTSEFALKGSLSIKLSSEMAQTVAAAQLPATRSGAVTRSGIGTIDDLLNEIGAERFERIITYNPEWEDIYDETGINRWYSVSFDESADLDQIGSRFAALPGVTVVEYEIDPAYIRPTSVGPAIPASGENLRIMGETRAATTMNDPMLPYQWHFDNTGPDQDFSQPKAGADINLLDAWQLCTGSEDIIVAVIDQPVQTDHPDLKANIWTDPKNAQVHGYNFWDDSSVLDWKTPGKENGRTVYADHGTHVAGVIAAVNNNGRGVCGIAGGSGQNDGVKIMSCEILAKSESGTSGAGLAGQIRAMKYAADNGAVICQNSWGYPAGTLSDSEWTRGTYSALSRAIQYFNKYAGIDENGVQTGPMAGGIVIFAAGNDASNENCYPAADPNVVSVASTGCMGLPSSFTNYGKWVSMSAPGGDLSRDGSYGGIYSTSVAADGNSGYESMQGTSMACPHVSGACALAVSYYYGTQKRKGLTAEMLRQALLSSTQSTDSFCAGDYAGYKGMIGVGALDTYKLLLTIAKIDGIPAQTIAAGESATLDLGSYFLATNVLTYTIADSSIVEVSLSGGTMRIKGLRKGETTVIVSDGGAIRKPIGVTVR